MAMSQTRPAMSALRRASATLKSSLLRCDTLQQRSNSAWTSRRMSKALSLASLDTEASGSAGHVQCILQTAARSTCVLSASYAAACLCCWQAGSDTEVTASLITPCLIDPPENSLMRLLAWQATAAATLPITLHRRQTRRADQHSADHTALHGLRRETLCAGRCIAARPHGSRDASQQAAQGGLSSGPLQLRLDHQLVSRDLKAGEGALHSAFLRGSSPVRVVLDFWSSGVRLGISGISEQCTRRTS